MIPPLTVVLVSLLLAAFVVRQPAAVAAPSTPGGQAPLAANPAAPAGELSPLFTPEVQFWRAAIVRWSAAAGVDPDLAAVVMQIESCGHPRARSSAGAMGLFQVMPFHFKALEDPYDPDTNALRGLGYLARALQAAGGDARLALAGYNGGIGVIARGEWTWSDQTRRYVYYGAPIYEAARSGLTASAALEEWHARYGAGLCRQARAHQ
jgi:soluble lytic murein transglycosylase-like protein